MGDDPVFDCPCGPIRGHSDGRVVRARGIPYARADRFRPPVPLPPWIDPLDATGPAPACPQVRRPFLEQALGAVWDELPLREDCQNLSVTVPLRRCGAGALPVIVLVHGGSYVNGSGDARTMDPGVLVAEQGVLVVNVTYRLGLFGFLGDGQDRPANLGLLDIIAAFDWVRRNISAFGGDPDAITAMGHSSGADAIAHLMATPYADRLFRRAILQSPPLGLHRGGLEMNHAMMKVASGEDLEALGEAEDRVAAAAARSGLNAFMPFGVQRGMAPLPAHSDMEDAWARAAPRIDLLIGDTAEEARLFLDYAPVLKRVTRAPILGGLVLGLAVALVSHAVYGRAIHRFARRHAKAGGRTYRYRFFWSAPSSGYGSAHAIELPFLLGDRKAWEFAEIVRGADWSEIATLGAGMRALWADFARGQVRNPSGEILGALKYRQV